MTGKTSTGRRAADLREIEAVYRAWLGEFRPIAEALEISTGTVGASLHAAHRSLRLAMEEAST